MSEIVLRSSAVVCVCACACVRHAVPYAEYEHLCVWLVRMAIMDGPHAACIASYIVPMAREAQSTAGAHAAGPRGARSSGA